MRLLYIGLGAGALAAPKKPHRSVRPLGPGEQSFYQTDEAPKFKALLGSPHRERSQVDDGHDFKALLGGPYRRR